MLPCLVGMAVSKLRIATRSTTKGRFMEEMIVSMTGSRADVVGLWSQESDATIAIFTTMHFLLIASRDQTLPSAWRAARVSWSVDSVSCWSMRADKCVECTGVAVMLDVVGV